MNGYKIEEAKRDICKNHTARCDRDSFRVCPSKLSKRELEDLYFTLLENNVDLKRTINGQQDKIKLLSTKVQRMTVAQKSTTGRENECCSNIKSMVNEQKQSIADLKKANERMSERIRVLNMRLCSAKQFLRRSPVPSVSRCAKCSAPPTFVKNSSMSIINAKGSDSNVKSAAASSQYLDKDVALSTRTVETETKDQEDPEKLCNENKCQSLIEELKQKVVNLQEELSKSHDEYTSRISHLEAEVNELRTDRERAQAQRASSAQQLQQRIEQVDQLGARLGAAEAQYGELSMELSIEKRKVAELETRVKAVDMSSAVAKTIEGFLKNNNLEVPGATPGVPSDATDQVEPSKAVTSSDDSGFVAESPDAYDRVSKKNLKEVLYERITCLQDQLEKLKLAAAAEKSDKNDSSCKAGPNKVLLFESDPGSPRRDSTHKTNLGSVVRVAKKLSKITEPGPSPISDSITPLKTDLDKPKESKLNLGEGKVKSTPSQNSPERTLHSVSINTDQKRIFGDDQDPEEGYSKGNNENRKSVYSANLEEEQPEKKPKSAKGDAHNSMQIPGPIPVEDIAPRSPSKIIERNKKRRRSSDGIKTPVEVKKDSTDSAISHVREVISLDDPSLTAERKEMAANEKKELENERSAKKEHKNIFIGESSNVLHQKRSLKSNTAISQATQSCTGTERLLLPAAPSGTVDSALIKVAGPSFTEKYYDEVSECVTPTGEATCDSPGAGLADAGAYVAPQAVVDSGVQATSNGTAPIELCARYARVCTCPHVPAPRRREVSVFRTCSGTLRFRTSPAPPLAACACAGQARDTDTQTYNEPYKEDEGSRRRSVTYSKKEQRTYSLPPRSPDNTDCEISSLSDLPSERDGKTPRVLSPGEERQTSTFTEYSAPTTTEYGTLSEGELPGAGGVGRRLSVGEAKVNFHDAKHAAATNTKSCGAGSAGTSPCMEDTLAAISQELALCRDLLRARRPDQVKPSKDASQMADLNPGPIALKRAAASPRIGDAFTPKCIFILHIGTVVLSDEAVINSRNLSLVLTWKFYDQNVTMTRMRAGRVVLFDFSTEYDVKITDQFLDYLKHDEMQLVICELDNQWEPFATCALRLRDALLHTNRRADMSLALVAGPQLRRERAARDALDAGDEVGVLDVWCMLRVDPALLPAINRAIAKSGALTERRKSASMASHSGSRCTRNNSAGRCLAQVTEDDRSTDDRLSHDLTITSHTQPKHSDYDYDKRPVPDNSSVGSQTRRPALDQQPQPRPPDSMTSQERFSQTPVSPEQRGQVGFKKDTENIDKDTQSMTSCPSKITSKVIVNEVTAKIRSAYEMKQALEETGSQTHSNASSWRGLVTRRLIPKGPKKSSATSVRTEQRGTFPSFFKYYNKDNMSRSSKLSKGYTASVMRPSVELEEPPELTKGNFTAQRVENCSKKSVTYNDWAKENNDLYFKSKANQDEAAIGQNIEITIMWLALNEECDAMTNANVQRLYVAYNFLGRSGADLETPVSLPKPATYGDKCYFHFSKTFQLNDCDLPLLGHMAKCRSANNSHDPRDCVVFTVISEPPEDPLGLDSCQDIGYAYLYLGDLVEYSAGSDTYTEVVAVLPAQERDAVCGVLAVRVDGLDVVRRCRALAGSSPSVDAA